MFEHLVANRNGSKDTRRRRVKQGIASTTADRRRQQDIGVSDERVGKF